MGWRTSRNLLVRFNGRLERSEAQASRFCALAFVALMGDGHVPFWNYSLGSSEKKVCCSSVCCMLRERIGVRARWGIVKGPSEITDHRRIPIMIPQRKIERKKDPFRYPPSFRDT
jgi:hypothetical protein